MKPLYKISVASTRSLFAMDFFPPEDWAPEDDTDQEDIFWDEESTSLFPDDSFPSDRWEPEAEIPSLPPAASTTLVSYGLFSKEDDGSFRISYEDTEITGLEGCLTTFCLAPTGMLIMLRRGVVKTCMVFEKGHRHLCDYGALGGAPTVMLHTHSLHADLDENGGTVSVDYSVELRGTKTERNSLFITVERVK